MRRRTIVLILLIAFSLTTVFAGGQADKKVDGKIPLSMWFWGASGGQQQTLQKLLIDRFNETHPEYHLTIEFRPSVNKDVAVALAANEGPDIVYESSPALSLVYIQSGKYADLTEYSKKYGWQDKLITPMYDSSSVDGKLYSIPMGLNYIAMVYNARVLRENGWKVPATIEELETIMDQAMARGMYGSVTGNKGWKPTNEDYTSLFLTNFAGPEEVYKSLTGQQDWNSPYIRFAIEKSREWFQKGYLGSDYTDLDWIESAALLMEGRAPFFFGPVKFIQNFDLFLTEENKDDIQIAVFPGGRPGVNPSYTIGATGILAINQNTKHKDVCAEFLDMFISAEFVAEMAETWPGYWGVPLKNLDQVDSSKFDGLTKAFLDSLVTASNAIDSGDFGYYCSSYFPPETFDLVCDIDSVWFNEISVENYLKSWDTSFKREAAQGLVPPAPVPGKGLR